MPTTAGESVLNPFHPFGLAKRLRRMPCSLVHEDHFLRIHEAEKAGLIKVSIKDEVRALCGAGGCWDRRSYKTIKAHHD